jgi:hypothetical protein
MRVPELSISDWNGSCAGVLQVMASLPVLLAKPFPKLNLHPSNHGHKLAVSIGKGSKYPKHLDNTLRYGQDNRKLTAIYYMNPEWDPDNGGALRLFHTHPEEGASTNEGYMDVAPTGDRLVLFYSDLMVHEVMPCWDEAATARRYTYTMWLTTENPAQIADEEDPFYDLREIHFPAV